MRRLWLAWWILSFACIVAAFSVTFILSGAANTFLVVASLASGLWLTAWCFRQPETRQNATALPVWKRGILTLGAAGVLSIMAAANLYMILLVAHTALSHDAHRDATVAFKGSEMGMPGRCSYYAAFRESPTLFLPMRVCVPEALFNNVEPGSPVVILGTQSVLGFRGERMATDPVRQP